MTISLPVVFEYLAFFSALASVYCYGHTKLAGPWVGMGTAVLFVVWGYSSGIYAAIPANFIFFGLHLKNLGKLTKRLEPQT